MYLHHYWPRAAVSDGNIVWKTSLMKIWCKKEAWEIGTPLGLYPESWDCGLMADVLLANPLGYSIFCLQTPVRAREWVDVIFYKGIMEVCVCTSSCVGRGDCRSKRGVRGVLWLFLLLKLLACPDQLCGVTWSCCVFLKMWENTNEHLWDFSDLIFLRKIRFPVPVPEGVSGCISLGWS